MSLVLSRVDYVTVGVTSRGTTQILPQTEPKGQQKFAVGDHEGVLHVFGMKKGELQPIFKSLPGPKIEKLVLGGSVGSVRDKIFIAYGNSVKGFTKKGKMFLEFDTSLIDTISAMYVLGPDLAACTRDLYHRYQNCKDADSYLVGEIVRDVVLVTGDNAAVLAILACNDNAIRVLSGTKTPTILRLSSVPTVLALYRNGTRESRDRILVGTQDGKVGLLTLQGNKTIRVIWLLLSNGSEITSLDTYELEDGVDILVGRQDGTVEVFGLPEDHDTTPFLRFRYSCGESISSVAGGVIGYSGYSEVLVTTFSGCIFGLTTRPPGSLEASINREAIDHLKAEIRELEAKLNEGKEFEDYPNDMLAPFLLSVNYQFILNRQTAAYPLSIELDTPIDNVLIQSDTPIQLLDESNSAVVSLSACNPYEGNFVLATYRCQVNTNRLEMKIRTIEGQSGSLQIYVTTQIQPKCCRKIRIPVHALSLHSRIHGETEEITGGPFNELKFSGGFTVAEMHAWLALALPDIPERPNLQDGEVTLYYVSTFMGTLLKCQYKKGSALFHGENISTIIILRDLLTKEATKRKIKLDVFSNIEEGSVRRVLELILPRLKRARELRDEINIINALQQWEMRDEPEECLSLNYQELLKREQDIRKQWTEDPDILQRLYGAITDLYVDWERARGIGRSSSNRATDKLNIALESQNLSNILQVFLGKPENPLTSSVFTSLKQEMED